MHATKNILLKTLIASTLMMIFLMPAAAVHAASFNFRDQANAEKFKTYMAQVKSEKASAQKPLSLNENITGTIKSISGADITVTVENPESGQPATVVVRTSSAKVSRAETRVADKKTKPGNDLIKKLSDAPKGSKHDTRSMTAASAGLKAGDIVNLSGIKNTDGTITAKRISAHAKKA